MADVTGQNTRDLPIISVNTDSILKYRTNYSNGTASIAFPLIKGMRIIIMSLVTSGNTISIGFSSNGSTISDERFTYSTAAGPIDLSNFFRNAPFSHYKEENYLLITGEAAKDITVSYVEFKG